MKRKLTLLLAIFAFATALAYEPATKRYGYDDELPLRGAVKQLTEFFGYDTLANGELVPDTTNRLYRVLDFDRAGNVIKETYHLSSNGSKRQDGAIYYAYDEQNRCVEEHRVGFMISHFVYDNRGLLVEEYEVDADGRKINHWAHAYNRKGRKVKSYPVEPKYDYIYEQYKYDRAGNVVKESRRYSNGKLYETKKMRYDKQGRLIDYRKRAHKKDMRLGYLRRHKSVIFDYTPHERKTFRYDERGRCVEERIYLPVKDFRATHIFSYDEFDNCIEEQRVNTKQGEPFRQSRSGYQYKYDAQGNWIERVRLLQRDGKLYAASTYLRQISYYE